VNHRLIVCFYLSKEPRERQDMKALRPMMLAGLVLLAAGVAALAYAPQHKVAVKVAMAAAGATTAVVDWVRARRQ
jgi:hypothetical protein